MIALSIRQPWAHAILFYGKDIENRTWITSYRGRFLIHASLTWDNIGYHALKDLGFNPSLDLPRGGIVGAVNIVDCVSSSSSSWWQGPVGFVLSDPQPLPFKKCKGRLGFFHAPSFSFKHRRMVSQSPNFMPSITDW